MKTARLGAFSAILASACCLGPLLLIVLGLGSLGLGAAIGRYHWFFLAAGASILVFAWVKHLKEKVRCDCERRPMAGRKASLYSLLAASALVAFFMGVNIFGYAFRAPSSSPSISLRNDVQEVTLRVEGVSCVTCEWAVELALKDLPGVLSAEANVGTRSARVFFEPSKVAKEALVWAVNQAGYRARLATSSSGVQ